MVESILLLLGGSGHRQERHSGWNTGWRTLPICLLETPEQGQWLLETESRSWRIPSKETIFIPSGLKHRLISQCDASMRSTWCMLNWEWHGQVLRFVPEPIILRAAGTRQAVLEISKLNKTTEKPLAVCARIQTLGLQIFAQVLDQVQESRVDERIRRALDALNANRAAHHSVRSLARIAGLSESRFHELFQEQVGASPMQHLKALRIRQAMEMLAHSTLSQSEIAARCGFQSLPYFNRAFRAATGRPPGRFRAETR
jgi:AraC-like DNA-binding protein